MKFKSALIMALTLTACGNREGFKSYGVDKIEIRMDDAYVGELFRGAPQKVFYPGKANFGGRNFVIALQPAGASTIREGKKSWDLKFVDHNSPFGPQEIRLASTISDRGMLRTPLSIAVFKAAGLTTGTLQPTFAYLNDRVLGLYHRLEKVDEHFFSTRKISWNTIFEFQGAANFAPDMILRLNEAFKVVPKTKNVELMRILAQINQLASDTDFETQLFQLLDRDNVVQYLAASLITNHYDGFVKNLYLYEANQKLRLVPWDYDLDWTSDQSSSFVATTPLFPWASSVLFTRIAALPSVRSAYIAQAQALLAGSLSFNNLKAVADQHVAIIREAYQADPILGQMNESIDANEAILLQSVQDRITAIQAL